MSHQSGENAACSVLPELADSLYLDLLKQTLTASLYDESAWELMQAPQAISTTRFRKIKRALKWYAFKAAFGADFFPIKKRRFDAAVRDAGMDWPLFGYTMIGHRRLDNIQHCVEDVLANGVPGDLIETGVWRGGAAILMRAILKQRGVLDRTVWLADSFRGLPPPRDSGDGADLSNVDLLAVSLEQVKRNFARFDLLDDRVAFLEGWFADTLPAAPIERLSVLRLDGDLYSSTMDALVPLYPKVSDRGYVIVDDYGSWPSCKRAVDDYLRQNGIKADIKVIDSGGVYWQVRR
jgi:hypothetical protein